MSASAIISSKGSSYYVTAKIDSQYLAKKTPVDKGLAEAILGAVAEKDARLGIRGPDGRIHRAKKNSGVISDEEAEGMILPRLLDGKNCGRYGAGEAALVKVLNAAARGEKPTINKTKVSTSGNAAETLKSGMDEFFGGLSKCAGKR